MGVFIFTIMKGTIIIVLALLVVTCQMRTFLVKTKSKGGGFVDNIMEQYDYALPCPEFKKRINDECGPNKENPPRCKKFKEMYPKQCGSADYNKEPYYTPNLKNSPDYNTE